MTRLAISVVALLVAAACGGAESFSPRYPEVHEPEFSRVVARLQAEAGNREEEPVVAGVTAGPQSKLFVYHLTQGRKLWERRVEARSAPVVAGGVVLVQEEEGIVARELTSGEERFTLDEEESSAFLGADGTRNYTIVSLRTGTAAAPHGRLVMYFGGSEQWERDVDLPTGVPAIVGNLVVVPWGTQRVTVLDVRTGAERARLRIRDDVIAHAFVDRGAVYFGQHGIFRVTPRVNGGTKTAAAYFAPRGRPLPGQPLFLRDGYEPVPPPDNAQHHVRLAWRPAGEGETVSLQDDTMYLVFYKFLYALDPANDQIRWVYTHPADIAGIAVQNGGVLIADGAGSVAFVTSGGQKVWEAQMGAAPAAAAIRTGAQTPWEPPARTEAAALPPLQEQLFAAARLDDDRLAGGRTLAISHLARTEGPDATRQLVEICVDPEAPDPVRVAACEKVGERTEGDQHVLGALGIRSSYLRGTRGPPVGALAKAAARMEIRRAVPHLIEHLGSPATRPQDLGPILVSLRELGVPTAAPAVEDFLRLYHADAPDALTADAVGIAAETLIALRGRAGEETVRTITDDPLTNPVVRERALRALTGTTEGAQAQQQQAQGQEQQQQPQRPPEPAVDQRPERLTPAMIGAALRPATRALQACVDGAPAEINSARIVVLVGTGGAVQQVSVTPASLQDCIEAGLRGVTFPETRRRDPITHTVRRRANARPAAPAPAGRGGARPAAGARPGATARPARPAPAPAPGAP